MCDGSYGDLCRPTSSSVPDLLVSLRSGFRVVRSSSESLAGLVGSWIDAGYLLLRKVQEVSWAACSLLLSGLRFCIVEMVLCRPETEELVWMGGESVVVNPNGT